MEFKVHLQFTFDMITPEDHLDKGSILQKVIFFLITSSFFTAPVPQKPWQIIIDHFSKNYPILLNPLSVVCQTLFRCATWRVEFSLEV